MKTSKLIYTLLLACFFATSSYTGTAQIAILSDSSLVFDASDCIKKSSGNRLIFYFDTDYGLVHPACASFFRESYYDSTQMVFDGPFKDFRYDSLLLVEGAYKNGYLDGPLTVRYMNGKIWQRGAFNEGLMVGTWEYFYPDGKPMYSLSFKNDLLYVQDVWNVRGEQLVKNGNGKIIIQHYNSKSKTNFLETSWRGKIKDGLLDGTWRLFYYDSQTKLSQIYSRGKFVKGYEGKKFFNAISYFGLGQEIALFNAEKAKIGTCNANPTNAIPPTYKSGWLGLKHDLYDKFDSLTNVKFKPADIVIAFNVDVEGNLSDFKVISETGYETHLINALKELGMWSPAINDAQTIDMKISLTFPYRDKIWRDNPNAQRTKSGNALGKEIKDGWNYGPPSSPAEKDPWIRSAGYKL